MPDFSIVTIVKGRMKQLNNLLISVRASTVLPFDVQIVFMEPQDDWVAPEGLNVHIQILENGVGLPLAAGRNLGFYAAKTQNIIFIDVDCIISPSLFENMLKVLEAKRIISAYPLYLPIVPDSGNYEEIKHLAVPHPSRENIPALQPTDHLQFWSLIFAIQKQGFKSIGGFDDTFKGYGAEDTDFAMKFHQAGAKLIFVRDYVLHQYHDKYDPPLNHFDSIIENARRYRLKWNALPMLRWLKGFEKMDLIQIDPAGVITILKQPTQIQIENCLSSEPY
ncbi:glycosyltransferase family 2 protein [Pedobacter sp. Leaf194]|uniref:glycosyltransferase family 2 protein n=1 Tax=Pedobacter sp. Leaf194 TaxID=1736297 RepID=UPI0007035255|nr:galactosyltransferase-related protein [Pedobacter sp. Leaf194]KQS36277.1 hypothetical protein ASG14_12700 [Pedobacter sp. Leaf194]